ncbi:hypothetical protein BaRGS_00011166 [Batillaria attramentaria]|uniref:Uncharacterized protein n=1 Tax=Batillaria attramentaria TaxID=370345 RepID=A0ABD0LDW5_9CAEN
MPVEAAPPVVQKKAVRQSSVSSQNILKTVPLQQGHLAAGKRGSNTNQNYVRMQCPRSLGTRKPSENGSKTWPTGASAASPNDVGSREEKGVETDLLAKKTTTDREWG